MTRQNETQLDIFCRKNWAALLGALLVFSILVSGYGTWLNYFYDIDEPKYARAVYEMVAQGNIFAPMFDGMPRMEKPPLAYWAMYPFALLAESGVAGENSLFLLRFPTIICSVLMVLGTALTGRRLFGPAVGLLAGLMLQSSVLFKFMAVMIKVDVVFACCVTWATYYYLQRYLGDRSKKNAVAGAVLTALGVLAKGPFAFLPMAGYILAEGIRYNSNSFATKEKGSSFLSLFNMKGLVAANWNERKIIILWVVAGCVPFFLWLYAAWLSSGFDYSQGLVGQFFHNTSTTGAKAIDKISRLDPYLDTLTVIFFPWGGYVFGTVYFIWKTLKERFNEKYVFMACVFLVYLVVFTLLFKLKSNRYMLPVLPLLSIMVCNWLVKAERDKAYSTLFEMGFIWLCSMAAMLGYRSFKAGKVSVNLADGVLVGQYMELVLPFFIALGCFFLVLLFVSIKQSRYPAVHIIGASVAIVAVMPFYYQTLPAYSSLTDNRPLPVMGPAVAEKLGDYVDSETLIIHRPFFIKAFPDVVYFLKKLETGTKCMYSLGSDAPARDVVQALATPAVAADLFKKEHEDAEKYPAYGYFKNTDFRKAVLLLSADDYSEFYGFFQSLPPVLREMIEIEELDVLTVKWVEHRVYFVRFNPERLKK